VFRIAGLLTQYLTQKAPEPYVTGDIFLPHNYRTPLKLDVHHDPDPPDLSDSGLVHETLSQWEALRDKGFITPADIGKHEPILFTLQYSVPPRQYIEQPSLQWSRHRSDDIVAIGSRIRPYHMKRLVEELMDNPSQVSAETGRVIYSHVA
jgi:hypothetical protein